MRLIRLHASALMFAACTVGPDYVPPEPSEQIYDQFSAIGDPAFKPGKTDLVRWWTVFHDPQLDDLIARAGEGNLDLAIAVSRVSEARARLGFSKSGRSPQVGLGGDVPERGPHRRRDDALEGSARLLGPTLHEMPGGRPVAERAEQRLLEEPRPLRPGLPLGRGDRGREGDAQHEERLGHDEDVDEVVREVGDLQQKST